MQTPHALQLLEEMLESYITEADLLEMTNRVKSEERIKELDVYIDDVDRAIVMLKGNQSS